MRNNTRGLIFHILIVILMFALATLIDSQEILKSIFYKNIVAKVILSILPLILYFNFAKAMSKRTMKRLDFFSGNLIFLLSIFLFMFAFVGLRTEIFNYRIGHSLWRFPLELFLFPQVYILKLFKMELSPLILILSAISPSIVYGISIKLSRAKMPKRIR